MSEAAVPLHLRLAAALERAFNPIVVRELRASLRTRRFFLLHSILLILIGGVLTLLLWAFSESRQYSFPHGEPVRLQMAEIGRQAFFFSQMVHLLVVFLVVPGFAASAITRERESMTFELMVTTTLTAKEIVWGKFAACMMLTALLFVSLLPVVAVTFFFGGVTFYQIVANYTFLIALSALMTALGLSNSATFQVTQRAVAATYASALGIGVAVVLILGSAFDGIRHVDFSRQLLHMYGFLSGSVDSVSWYRLGLTDLFDIFFVLNLGPGLLWILFLSLAMVNAINRLQPIEANRSTPYRIVYASFLAAAGLYALALVHRHLGETTRHLEDRGYAVATWLLVICGLAVFSSLFAAEEAPRRAATGGTPWLRLFRPGPTSGALFSCGVNLLFLTLSGLALAPLTRGIETTPVWNGRPGWTPLLFGSLVAAAWIYFVTSAALFLGDRVRGRPVLKRALVLFLALFLAGAPLLHWAAASEMNPRREPEQTHYAPVTIALSPVISILTLFDTDQQWRDFPFYVRLFDLEAPIWAASVLLHIVAGLILHQSAFRRMQRRSAAVAA